MASGLIPDQGVAMVDDASRPRRHGLRRWRPRLTRIKVAGCLHRESYRNGHRLSCRGGSAVRSVRAARESDSSLRGTEQRSPRETSGLRERYSACRGLLPGDACE